jgi:hypothetical protein
MTKRKLFTLLATAVPLLLYGGAALAAASGVAAIDTPVNAMGRAVQATGFGLGAIGTVGVIHHIRSGSWLGMLEHLGITVVGSGLAINFPTYAPTFGGEAAALIHPILNHPVTHLLVHAASRAVS